ncbi:MAG: hypothetical protein HQL27_02865 [Candidatus Omnitrophica bacterium]|nr:hypothetical protein [Candidatus Omnitrophota bacterium]
MSLLEPVLRINELGIYNFLLDQPTAEQFPMSIFSWINKRWHFKYIESITKSRPKIVIADTTPPA